MSFFRVLNSDPKTAARTGVLKTAHGDVRTPIFMPVGTQASVKTISNRELDEVGAEIILANAYHLRIRPGAEVIEKAGGLHSFMNWTKPILTDSGGFQVFSLGTPKKIKEEGVEFQSHVDGARIFLTPEDVIRFETILGSDIIMPLDECVAYPASEADLKRSVRLTSLWAKRSKAEWKKNSKASFLFGIVQGGTDKNLRRQSARELVDMDFPGYAVGGLSVGEPSAVLAETLAATVCELPREKPRYLMGVGTPLDLLDAIGQGVDMFDCVIPTRNGRNATVFTKKGTLLLRGASYTQDWSPIEADCPCYTCRTHSRAYLRHLFNVEEYLAGRLASLHNLTFFIELFKLVRSAIDQGRYAEFRSQFQKNYTEKKS